MCLTLGERGRATEATPAPSATPSASPTPLKDLPISSSLFFVLDDTLKSYGVPDDTIVRAHLKSALVIDGVTVAEAGAPEQIKILSSHGASAGDQSGYVDIYFLPFPLKDGTALSLRAPTMRLTPRVTTGQESTIGIADTVGDIFVPYYFLASQFRKGKNVVLKPGFVLRARTAESLSIEHGAVVVKPAAPIAVATSTPHPAFDPMPMVTPTPFLPKKPQAPPSAPVSSPSPTTSPQ